MSSYYHVIDGQRYDARVLRAAATIAAQPFRSADEPLGVEDAAPVLAAAQDGKRVTKIEADSLRYVVATYSWTPEAEAALLEAAGGRGAAREPPELVVVEEEEDSPSGRSWLEGVLGCAIA